MAKSQINFGELGGGGVAQFTLLWTNSSSLPLTSFADQNVTLSQSMDDFDLLCIYYQATASDTNTFYHIYVDVKDFKTVGDPTSGTIVCAMGSTANVRRVTYINSTTIHFTASLRIGQTGNVTNVSMPYKIYGVKVDLSDLPSS